MNGVQTIDLSVPKPLATSNFSFSLAEGASFVAGFSSWRITQTPGFMKFNMSAPDNHGVALILKLASGLIGSSTNCPITITVNGETLVADWDPHDPSFYNKSWYMPSSMLKSGNNEILVTLSGAATTAVYLQAASIMTFQMQHQQQTQWCWSAVTTSTSLYFSSSSDWTQCSLVNALLDQTTCCEDGGSEECNNPWYLSPALTRTGNLADYTGSSQPVGDVEAQINIQRPLGARIQWKGGGNHFVMLTGVGQDQTMVAVEDPWSGSSYVTYSTFLTKYMGTGTWKASYFTKD